MLTGCGGGQTGGNYTSNDKARAAADSLMGQAMAAADAGRMLVLADSLEAADNLRELDRIISAVTKASRSDRC